MQLVIRLDMDRARQLLPEIVNLIGGRSWTEEIMEYPVVGASGPIRDNGSHLIGEWEIEESSERANRHPLEHSYRAAAISRYVQPRQIEVDRFAQVSLEDDGAFVQGWLFVPRAEVVPSGNESTPPSKPPQSVVPIRGADSKAG